MQTTEDRLKLLQKVHCSKRELDNISEFLDSELSNEFENYYKTHTVEESINKFNLTKREIQLTRKALQITDFPKRVVINKINYKSKIYNNGKQEIKIREGYSIPEGFLLGRLPKSEETCKKISAAKQGKESFMKNKLKYTNGSTVIFLNKEEEIPEGFYKYSQSSKNKIACNNGKVTKYFSKDAVPDGWTKGEIENKLKTEITLKAKEKNKNNYQRNNNCTTVSALKKLYKTSWYRDEDLKNQLEIFKYKNVLYVPNKNIDKIASYIPRTNIETIYKEISEFERANNCTLLSKFIEKYGQLTLFKDLKKLYYKKYQFIPNDLEDKIKQFVEDSKNPYSNEEKDLYKFIKSIYNGEVLENVNNIIYSPKTNRGLEIDIYIPDKKIAIEFNGTYWHSSACGKEKTYHEDKSKLCESLGIRLIHIYETEWKFKRDKIEQLLRIALNGVQTRIFARKCTVKNITNQEAEKFSNITHLQGHRNATVTYGLFYQDELVQLMSFSKTANAKRNGAEWEIIRGCPGSNNIVIGGVSKLFTHFIRDYKPTSVFSYCDFNKFDGKSYEALGMKFIGYTGPDKYWVINGEMVPRNASRYKELKEKSSAIVWGAGSKKYIWKEDDAVSK